MKNIGLKIFLTKLMYFLPLLGFMVAVSYIADPANVFGESEFEKQMAEYLIEGKNIANVSNYNERIFQKYHVEKLSSAPDYLVIGSSRAMQVSSDIFPDNTLFNASVSNAVVQDYLSITYLYEERDLMPSTVILGIDPWIFNRNNTVTRWKELEEEYFSELDRISKKSGKRWHAGSIIEQRYLMLLNPQYFQRSLRIFFVPEEQKKDKFTPTDESEGEYPIKLSDGSYVYERSFREKTVDEVRAAASRIQDDYRLVDFTIIDSEYRGIFESYVDYLSASNVKVIFLLTPYHPVYYRHIRESRNLRTIIDVEDYIGNLANEKGIALVGSYNPSKCELEEKDFYDHAHPKREAVKRIFEQCEF